MDEPKFYPLLVRLRPRAKALLDQASAATGRSRSLLIHEAIIETLDGRHDALEDRLAAFLDQGKA
jgi:uncharacterized protein (DUF1778 family)